MLLLSKIARISFSLEMIKIEPNCSDYEWLTRILLSKNKKNQRRMEDAIIYTTKSYPLTIIWLSPEANYIRIMRT